jgi:hypothetical protein
MAYLNHSAVQYATSASILFLGQYVSRGHAKKITAYLPPADSAILL